jgi:hypothetical protein
MSDGMADRNLVELRRDIGSYVDGCRATMRTPSNSDFSVVYPRWSGLDVTGMIGNALRASALRSMIGHTDPLLDEVE